MDKESKFISKNMRPDLGIKEILIPSDKDGDDFTNICNDDNKCILNQPDDTACINYKNYTPVSCQKGQLPVSLVNLDASNSEKIKDLDGCTANFVSKNCNDNKSWLLSEDGVIGLRPTAEF